MISGPADGGGDRGSGGGSVVGGLGLVGRCSVPSSSRIQTRPISMLRNATTCVTTSETHLCNNSVPLAAPTRKRSPPSVRRGTDTTQVMPTRQQADCRLYSGCYIGRLPTPDLQTPRLHADVRRRNFGPAWGRTDVAQTLPDGRHRASLGTEPAWGRSRLVDSRSPRSPTVPANQAGSVPPGHLGGELPALPSAPPQLSPRPPQFSRHHSSPPQFSPVHSPLSPRHASQLSPASPRPTSRLSPRPRLSRELSASRGNEGLSLSPWPTLRPDTAIHHMVYSAGPTLYRPDTAMQLEQARRLTLALALALNLTLTLPLPLPHTLTLTGCRPHGRLARGPARRRSRRSRRRSMTRCGPALPCCSSHARGRIL